MNRFMWLIRREIWEHKAIWVAPLIVLACLLVAAVTGNVHLGPLGAMEDRMIGDSPVDKQVLLLMLVYSGLALVVFMVMGIVGFFYSLDSLYADRRDRSVLFWKSLPLSDAETVLSKFTIAAVVIPLVAMVGAVLAQFVVAGGGATMLSVAGLDPGIMWRPQALVGGAALAVLWAVTAMLWYAPCIAYLMLASAWAPKGPFLWAVLPPVALSIAERVLLQTGYIGDFISQRMFGLYQILGARGEASGVMTDDPVRGETIHLDRLDFTGMLKDLYTSPELWLGVVAAALLLAGAMWVRRYRDENS